MGKSVPKYILVENYIKDGIRKKELTDKLPGERVLAKQLGVSYMTVRKSIDNLVNAGLLYKVPTQGTFVDKNNSKRKKSRTIGYFLDSSIVAGISSPYYSLIFHAIEKYASDENYSVIYFSDADKASFEKTLQKLDGVIATCFPRIENTILKIKQSVPVVVIDNSAADKTIPSIIIDNFNANVESVDFICSQGHKRIGFMTGLDDSDVGKNRYAGYRYGLEKNSIEFDNTLVYRGNYSYEAGMEGAEHFLSMETMPTAIICANDAMALGAIQKLTKEGFDVPDDISIIGFDDIEVASQIVPSLTTVAAPFEEIAQLASKYLQKLINGETLENQHNALRAHLVVRDSSKVLKQDSTKAA